ncbi:MAG: CHASE domain-containing protein [Gammaproteobacteria bacterium]|nr:CHASE domain-containing protein [Gammaproteobacteria bacterium]
MKLSPGPVIIFAAGITLSLFLSLFLRDWKQSEIQQIFEQKAQNRLALFKLDIIRHEEIVSSIVRLFNSSERVTREEFRVFTMDALAPHHTVQGLSWNPLIRHEQRQEVRNDIRRDGMVDFQFTELNDNGKLNIAPDKDSYIIVNYIEPQAENIKVMGFNIASNKTRLDAINRARDTGNAVITESIKLIQTNKKGYLLFKAVYEKGKQLNTISARRNHFKGLAVGIFQFENWMEHALENIKPVGIDIWLSDLSAEKKEEFFHFFSSRTRTIKFEPTAEDYHERIKGLHWQEVVNVLGREWVFHFTPTGNYLKQQSYWESWATFFGGLFFTLVLSFYMHSKARYVNKLKESKRVLTIARNEANLANEFKSQFLSRMSHELRTPMNAVLGFGQMLDMNSEGFSEIQKDNVKEIMKAGEHLMSLINELLDLSRIEAGKMNVTLTAVSVDDVIKECASLIAPQLKTLNLEFINAVDESYIVKADFIRLKQILLNLLSNAVKYNCKDGKITLTSEISANNLLRISVTDTGEGLTEKELGKLFVSFERMNKTESIGGAGIGLVITKYLVELMGGNIGVNSVPGKGSTFWIEIALCDSIQITGST